MAEQPSIADADASRSSFERKASESYHKWKLEKRTLHLPFDVENWIQWIEPVSFRTSFISLSLEEGKAILARFRFLMQDRDLSPASLGLLQGVEKRLDDCIHQYGDRGCFVRLSSRSPKDALCFDEPAYTKALAHYRGEFTDAELADPLYDGNLSALAFCEALFPQLRRCSGRDALNLLCSSQRTLEDLLEATEAHEVWSLKLVVREWEPRAQQDREFRGFVHDGRLVALSQYNHYVYAPFLLRERDAIQAAICRYFTDEVAPRVPLQQYVCDFMVLRPLRPDDPIAVRVVELNPYLPTTGPGLFDWKADAAVLEGRAPFEFRLHAAPLPFTATAVREAWIPETRSLGEQLERRLADEERLVRGESTKQQKTDGGRKAGRKRCTML